MSSYKLTVRYEYGRPFGNDSSHERKLMEINTPGNWFHVMAGFAQAWYEGYREGYYEVASVADGTLGYACEPQFLRFFVQAPNGDVTEVKVVYGVGLHR